MNARTRACRQNERVNVFHSVLSFVSVFVVLAENGGHDRDFSECDISGFVPFLTFAVSFSPFPFLAFLRCGIDFDDRNDVAKLQL